MIYLVTKVRDNKVVEQEPVLTREAVMESISSFYREHMMPREAEEAIHLVKTDMSEDDLIDIFDVGNVTVTTSLRTPPGMGLFIKQL